MKGLIEVTYKTHNWSLGLLNEWALKQTKVDEFEEPTNSYFIQNLFFQYAFTTDEYVHNFSLNFDNIWNKEYRNHLSRVKSILPEAGRNVRLLYKLYFHM